MELIITLLPIIFFLFSIFEARKNCNVIGYGNLDRLPKSWVRVEPSREKSEEDGLNQLDYLSEAEFDFNRFKNQAKYVYTKSL